MFSILIVDDEITAVKGIKQGIDWESLGIGSVFEAYDAEEALDIMTKQEIDILISDIEMPGWNGLELLDKVDEFSPDTITILLTGHAKFDYAQLALKKGCFDYLLKPIDHKRIEGTIVKALEKIKEKQDHKDFLLSYDKFSRLWRKQQPVLVERLWQDIFSNRVLNYNHLSSLMELYNMEISPTDQVVSVLLSIELWEIPLGKKDEEILRYGLKNMAAEILEKRTSGTVFQNHDGNIILIIYPNKYNKLFIPNDDIDNICKKIIKIAENKLHCSLSCYISDPVIINKLEDNYNHLLELERNNVKETNAIIYQSKFSLGKITYPPTPIFNNWQLLFELGEEEELLNELEKYFKENIDEMVNSEVLENFYYGFLHMIYSAVHKKNISVDEIYDLNYLQDLSVTRSYLILQKHLIKIIREGISYFNENIENNSTLIKKIHEFISNNYKEKISRNDIASYVYLNPAYLSRLFKKETGKTLTEYVTDLRINEAKRLLVETDNTITAVAEEIGYYNYSYFSKVFKDIVGVTPGDYRKNYQEIG